MPNVQWKTPDDGQRNCPKHVEFLDKNKFGKLVHLVGFVIQKLSLRSLRNAYSVQQIDYSISDAIKCNSIINKHLVFLISSFRRVLYVVCFLLGNYPTSGIYMPTFRNTLSVPSS